MERHSVTEKTAKDWLIDCLCKNMRKIILTFLVCSMTPILSNHTYAQDSTKVSLQNLKDDVDKLKKELQDQIEISRSLQKDSERTLEIAGKIIDWSAMFFTALTVILIIAGAVGLKEFSNIRKIEIEMKTLNEEMNKEIERMKVMKNEVQKDLDEVKENIEKDSRQFLRVVYLLNEGISSYHVGDLSNAIDAFLKVKRINPNDYEATCFLARSYIGQEMYGRAIETLQTALTLSEKPDRAFSIMGEAYRHMKKFDDAIEAFKKSISLNKKASTLNNLGYSYLKKKEYDQAINTFRESLEIKRYSTASCGLAKGLIKKHLIVDAHKYFQETIVLAEEDIAKGTIYVWPYYNLAFAHLALNNQNECLDILIKAFERNKNPSVIKEQLIDYKVMKDEESIPQDLLNKCIDLFDKTLFSIKKF